MPPNFPGNTLSLNSEAKTQLKVPWGVSAVPNPGSPQTPSRRAGLPPVLTLPRGLPQVSLGLLPKERLERRTGGLSISSCPGLCPNMQKGSKERRGGSWRRKGRWHPAPGTRPSPLSDPAPHPCALCPCQATSPRSRKQFAHGLKSSPSWGYLHYYYDHY